MNTVSPHEEFCISCRLCETYCATEHSQTRDVLRAFFEEQPKPEKRIFLQQYGASAIALNCRHCDEPRCVWACVSGALTKDPSSGVVRFQSEKCIGCWTCIVACPYGVIARDQGGHKIVKCDLCPGREVPACVTACPNRALTLEREAVHV